MKKPTSIDPKENLIHIKLSYLESKEAKKDILSSELNLLKTSKHISNYKALRLQELKKKQEIAKKLKELKSSLNELEKILPTPKIPKILQKKVHIHETEKHEPKKQEITIIKSKNDIESQLIEIQSKLKELDQ